MLEFDRDVSIPTKLLIILEVGTRIMWGEDKNVKQGECIECEKNIPNELR